MFSSDEEVGVEEGAGTLGAGTRPSAKRDSRSDSAGVKRRGALLTTRESEIEERSLHCVARHAKTAGTPRLRSGQAKMPGYSGRDDKIGESPARTVFNKRGRVQIQGLEKRTTQVLDGEPGAPGSVRAG